MSLSTLMQNIEDWCGSPAPGHPPRPPWLRDILTAVVMAEMSTNATGAEGQSLYVAAARLYESAARKVALNPQPLPPLQERTGTPTGRGETMKAKTASGPTVDKEFFADLKDVFARHPDVARKYAVRDRSLETDLLQIDFNRQYGVSRIEDGRIITEFRDRSDQELSAHHMCCEWVGDDWDGGCVFWCLE